MIIPIYKEVQLRLFPDN